MKKIFFLSSAFLFFLGTGLFAQGKRMVSLTLATDEILSELVAPERVQAVTFLASDPEISNVNPEWLSKIPKKITADMEQILACQPDLVFAAPYTRPETLKFLSQTHISVVKIESFNDTNIIASLDYSFLVPENGKSLERQSQTGDNRLRVI